MKRQLKYLPVESSRYGYMSKEQARSIQDDYGGKEIAWWTEDALFPHDGLLMSAFYGLKPYPTRETLDLKSDVTFFGDSGGFQLYSMGQKDPAKYKKVKEYLNPKKIIDWQQSVCNIGMTLDVPLNKYPPYYTEAEFIKKSSQSKHDGDIMRANHTNKDFQLFDVIHGRNLDDMKRWMNITQSDYDFDGYSFVTKHTETLALDLGFALTYSQNKPFHILGVSSPQSIILIAHANRYAKSTIYFDSSSYLVGGAYRRYVNPFFMGGFDFYLPTEDDVEDANRFESIFCPCPVCSGLIKPSELWLHGPKSGYLINLHNLYWTVQYTKMVEEATRNTTTWYNFIKRNAKPKIQKAIEFIDDVIILGLDDAYIKHYDRSTQKMDEWL